MYSITLHQLHLFYHLSSPSNGKLEVFNKYLIPTHMKLCENEQNNWDQYINQLLASYHVTPDLATAKTPFFLILGRDLNLPLHQLLEPI